MKKIKIAAPIKSQKGLELQYKKELNKLGRAMIKSVREELLPYLKAEQDDYVVDGIADNLSVIFKRLNVQFNGAATMGFAKITAAQMVTKVGATNKRRFNSTVEKVTGINFGGVIRSEGLGDFMELSINTNIDLIQDLPVQYLNQIKMVVNKGVVSGSRYSTIAKEITAKVGSVNSKLANRIKTIARNEVQTINSQLSLRRNEALGITKGIYMTSSDERVRPCHAELDGVEYDLAKGAWSKTCQKFIQPGITDINCRCSFRPVIEVDEITPVKKTKKKVVKKVVEKAPVKKKFKNVSKISNKEKVKIFGETEGHMPKILKDYTSTEDYSYMNHKLRYPNEEEISDPRFKRPAEKTSEQIKEFDKLLANSTIEEDIKLKRGLSFSDENQRGDFINGLSPGVIFEDKGYTSTTAAKLRDDFIGTFEDEPAIAMEILAPKGSKGLYVNKFSGGAWESEEEVILPRGQKFKVVSKKQDPKNELIINMVVELI